MCLFKSYGKMMAFFSLGFLVSNRKYIQVAQNKCTSISSKQFKECDW